MDGKQVSISTWLPNSPFRSPAWRWYRANFIHCHGKQLDRRIDDQSVMRALAFLRSPQQSTSRTVGASDPDLANALRIFEVSDLFERSMLEAYLLTDEPADVIAQRCQIESSTLTTFHEIFFDVRGRLAAKDWILAQAIGGGPATLFAGVERAGVLKYTALAGGALALEVTAAVMRNKPIPDWVHDRLKLTPHREAEIRLGAKLQIVVMTAKSVEELIPYLEIHDRLQKATGRNSNPAHSKLSVLKQFLRLAARRPSARQRSKSTDLPKQPAVLAPRNTQGAESSPFKTGVNQ